MMQVSGEKRQNAWGCQGSPMDHRVTRNLLLLARVVLMVMLMVFSISSPNASAQDTQHQGIAAGLIDATIVASEDASAASSGRATSTRGC
jgi:hypothetical protein